MSKPFEKAVTGFPEYANAVTFSLTNTFASSLGTSAAAKVKDLIASRVIHVLTQAA